MSRRFLLTCLLLLAISGNSFAVKLTGKNDLQNQKLAKAIVHSDNKTLRRILPKIVASKLTEMDRSLIVSNLIENKNFEGLSIAFQSGIDLNQPVLIEGESQAEILRMTPLNYAIGLTTGKSVVLHLISLGVDVDRSSADDMPPLLAAASVQAYDIMEYLLLHHANPNATDKIFHISALMLIAGGKKSDDNKTIAIMRKLIEYKADVNTQSITGHTALMLAARAGNAEAVQLLLQANADVGRASDDGDTALSIATKMGVTDIVHILEKQIDK